MVVPRGEPDVAARVDLTDSVNHYSIHKMTDSAAGAPATLDPALVQAIARHGQIVRELGPAPPGLAGERLVFDRAREWWNEGGPAVRSRDDVVPVGTQGVRVAIYEPEASDSAARPAYVYLHGGGYRFGSPRANDRQLRELAHAWGGIVVSCDYAHVPEARFPVAVEQTALVYRWLSGHGASWGIDGGRLAVGGSSAGANVALGAAVHGGGVASGFLQAAACIVGVFDDDLATPSMLAHSGPGLYPNKDSAAVMFDAYRDATQRDDPRSNLLRADAALLPPTFLAAAAIDAFRDSSVQLARHLADTGRPVELNVYDGMTHMFFGYSRMVPAAQRCIADLAAFLHRHLPSGAASRASLP
jgi:acetyl esterase